MKNIFRNQLFSVIAKVFTISVVISFMGGCSSIYQFGVGLHVQYQVTKQYSEPEYTGKKELNFTTFEPELSQLSEQRIEEIDHLVQNTTIPQIQQLFQTTQLASEELVLYYVARIKRYDVNKLNSVLELNPDALKIARQLDAERKSGQLRGSLHGIPVLLKDNIGTGDQLHTTAGAKALENARSDRDAFLVRQLREAGAIILGKNNLSEWANYMTSGSSNGFSVLGGQTKNPYGRFDVGGSSSGSAVSVAANFTTISVGTETNGSLIYPASQNSVISLKPSLGLVSRDRIIPITDAFDSAGPIARNVTDLCILLTVLAKSDSNDPITFNTQKLSGTDFTRYLLPDGLKGIRIGVAQNYSYRKSPDQRVIKSVNTILKNAGAVIVEVSTELSLNLDISAPPDILNYGLKNGVNNYLSSIGNNTTVHSLDQVIIFNKQDLANRAPYGQYLLEQAQNTSINATQYQEMVTHTRLIVRKLIRQALADNQVDILLIHGNMLAAINAPAGFPALTIPAGYRETGEPIGITLIGDYLDDPKLISIAYAFEQAANLRKDPVLKNEN